MSTDRVTVSSVLNLNWYTLVFAMVVCCSIGYLTDRIESLVWLLVVYFALVVAAAVISFFVYGHVFMDQVTLSSDGIVQKNRLRTKSTPWDQIAQAGFMSDKSPRVLVLVKADGSKRKNPDTNLFFYLRNTGKLVVIPDEPGVLDLVNRHYGALDFDLTADTSV